MPTALVLLPTTTYRARDFVAAAESLGVDLVVASEQPPPLDMGDRYLQVDCSDPQQAAEQIAALGDRVGLDGIVAADDAGVVVAALAGSALGLAANPPDAAEATRNKLVMRRRLEAAEVPQPRFAALEADVKAEEAAAGIGYPLVVKPVARSASQGVIRVDRVEDLGPTVGRVRDLLESEKEPLLIESYLPGEEVAVEGLVRDGELTVLAIFDKPDTPPGPSFPETILLTPSRLSEEAQAECVRVAEAALRGLGVTHGPVHVELKLEGRRAAVLEVAGRSIGGLCSRSLSFGLMGTTLEALILRNALGLDKPELAREKHASGVLMIPIPRSGVLRSVEGIEETRSIEGVTGVDLTITPGQRVLAPPEGDRYLGFVFARAETPEVVERALRKAKESITVVVD